MYRRVLSAAILVALVSSVGLVSAGEGGDAPQPPENRFFVIGDNSGYYRPGMPRPVVPTNKDADVYFLREKLRLLERKLAAIEQQAAEPMEDNPPTNVKRAAVPFELPAPKPYTVASKSKFSDGMAKKTVKSGAATKVSVGLPELPPLVLATDKPGDIVSNPETDILPALPVTPQRAELALPVARTATVSNTSLTDTSMEDSVINMARAIIESAREKVFELIASVAESRRNVVAQAVMAPNNSARGVIAKLPDTSMAASVPAAQTMVERRTEWVVLYRLPNEQISKSVTEKLDAFRVPVGSREFLDGEYLMEVGVFEDEERARLRVLFLGHIVGMKPELRVRTTVASRTAGVHG